VRQHGDLAVKDLVTGNYYSGDAVFISGDGGTAGGGGIKRLPGYLDQMDQMLYRDFRHAAEPVAHGVVPLPHAHVRGIGTAAATRTGWFHGDPLAVVAGNFISSSAAVCERAAGLVHGVRGAPVNDAACVYSDGVTRPVYDKQRRWFSEVLRIFGSGANYYEIFQRPVTARPTRWTRRPRRPRGRSLIPAATISNVLGVSPGACGSCFASRPTRVFGW